MNNNNTQQRFPVISTSKFCFPKRKATEIVSKTMLYWKDQHSDYPIDEILFCVDQSICQYVCDILSELAPNTK